MMHYTAALSVFSPRAPYHLASVALGPPPSTDNLLNFSKNRFAFVPVFSVTYLNPKTGIELSVSLSTELSLSNGATDWQSAPLLNFEAAALQHLRNGFALGVAGYACQQLGEDTGTGPENFKAAVGAASLQARVFGVGPIMTYQTKVSYTPVNFKLKFTHEFESRRRFESNVVTGAFGVAF